MFYTGHKPWLRCFSLVDSGCIPQIGFFLSYVAHSPLLPIFYILLIFSFFLSFSIFLLMEFQYLLISAQHTVKDTKKCLVELWLLAHSQASETKLINMTNLANNSLMLRCVREIWGKKYNCIIPCSFSYEGNYPHSQTAKQLLPKV